MTLTKQLFYFSPNFFSFSFHNLPYSRNKCVATLTTSIEILSQILTKSASNAIIFLKLTLANMYPKYKNLQAIHLAL